MPIYEIDPTKKERRIAFRQLGPIPIPIPWMEERRRIVKQVSSGDSVDVSDNVAATIFGDRWVNVAPIDADMGVILSSMGKVLVGEQINRNPNVRGKLWYKEEVVLEPGVYERLDTERRHAIGLRGWMSEKRHQLGRKYKPGDMETLRVEENDGYMSDGVVGVVLSGNGVRLATAFSGRYVVADSTVLVGDEVNKDSVAHEKFHVVLPKAS